MKAKELLTKLNNQSQLAHLLESYKDSDWPFYLQLKDEQETLGVTRRFYSVLTFEELQRMNQEDLLDRLMNSCFSSVRDRGVNFNTFLSDGGSSPQSLMALLSRTIPQAYWFLGDKVELTIKELSGSEKLVLAGTSKKIKFDLTKDFQTDYQPHYLSYELQARLLADAEDRKIWEKTLANQSLKTEVWLQLLKNEVQRGLGGALRKIRNGEQSKLEIAEEIAAHFGWRIQDFQLVEGGEDLSSGKMWDFELKDLALVRQLYINLLNNSPIFLLFKAQRMEKILAAGLKSEREQALILWRGENESED